MALFGELLPDSTAKGRPNGPTGHARSVRRGDEARGPPHSSPTCRKAPLEGAVPASPT